MTEKPLSHQFYAALSAHDFDRAREILVAHPGFLQEGNRGDSYIRAAARKNDLPMLELLVEFGMDVNSMEDDGSPEGPIVDASREGAIDAVRWLLNRGARVNCEINGAVRCFALTGAVRDGHFDVVKLLVEEGGADINAIWADNNALSFAIMYSQHEIADYLRSKGAKEPWELRGQTAPARVGGVLEHFEKHLGKPEPLALRQIVPADPPIAIHAVKLPDQVVLFTCGMSDKPMTVPKGAEAYQFAELAIYLPPDWPLTAEALQDPNHSWPIEWLQRIAHYPHVNQTWLGGPVVVFSNDDPPQPLAPNTKMTCLMAIIEESDFGNCDLPDGRRVLVYSVYPLYTEERDLEQTEGAAHLVQLFEARDVSHIVDAGRPNVVTQT